MKFLKKYYPFLISLVLTVSFGALFYFHTIDEFYPDSQIKQVALNYTENFHQTAHEIERSLLKAEIQIDSLHFIDMNQEEKMNFLFQNINSNSRIKGLMVLEHNGKFSIINREANAFVFASDSASSIDNITWSRIDKNLHTLNSWTMALGYELNILSWGEDTFNESYRYRTPLWSSTALIFGANNGNIATHITWKSPSNNKMITCILIMDRNQIVKPIPSMIRNEFQSFLVNMKNIAIPLQGGAVDLPTDSNNLNQAFNFAKTSWEKTGKQYNGTFSYIFQGKNWWGQAIPSDIDGINSVVLNVTETGLFYSSFMDNIYELSGLLILLLITLFLFSKNIRKSHLSLDEFISRQNTDKHASELVHLGENTHLEFKSSFRYDYQLNVVNKELEGVIAKSIAAFSNGSGGTLLIGVDDEGNILGLEKDIQTLKRKDLDFFENTLRTFLNKNFGVAFVTQNLEIKFPVIDQKVICRINIKASSEPIFVEIAKNSNKTERFYLRSGNTSQEITSLSEMNNYIKDRFKN